MTCCSKAIQCGLCEVKQACEHSIQAQMCVHRQLDGSFSIIVSMGMCSIPNLLIRYESMHFCACRQLDVSFNRLDSLSRFPELPSLQWLSVEGNELQSLASCPHLSRLTWLSLANNRLTSLEGKRHTPFTRRTPGLKIYTYTVSLYHCPYVKHISNVREHSLCSPCVASYKANVLHCLGVITRTNVFWTQLQVCSRCGLCKCSLCATMSAAALMAYSSALRSLHWMPDRTGCPHFPCSLSRSCASSV
jgi:hypothetical protein